MFSLVGLLPSSAALAQLTTDKKLDRIGLQGTVLDLANGTPIGQAEVTLTAGFVGNNPTVTAETDDEGRFGFRGLPPGDYFVRVRKQRYVLNQSLDDPMPAVVLLPGQTINLRLQLVAQASITGQIVNETGRPLNWVPVRALRFADGSAVQEIRAQAVTEEWGRYQLSGLIPGRYKIVTAYVHSKDYQQLAGNSFPLRSYQEAFYPGTVDPTAATLLEVAAGEHLAHIDFALDGGDWNQVRGRILLTVRPVGPVRSPSLRLVPRVPQPSRKPYSNEVLRNGFGTEYSFVVRGVMPSLYDLQVTWHYLGEEFTSQTEVVVGSSDLDNVVVKIGP